MSLIALVTLLFDGIQVLVENIQIFLILSVNILGIGLLAFWAVSTSRVKRGNKHWVTALSLGLGGFVLLSYATVVISRFWHAALPFLSNGLFLLSGLGCAIGFLGIIKKNARVDSRILSSRLPSLG